MKKTIKLLSIVFLAGAMFMSCEGPAGEDGLAGADGTPGADGNLTCLECHSSVKMDAIADVFATHKHNAGTSWAYAGNRGYCNPCHSGDSYVEFVRTGTNITGPGDNLECGTCHVNHTSLEDDIDAPVREVGLVKSQINSSTYDHGAGNLCATCHVARSDASDYDVYTTATVDTVDTDDADEIAYYTAAIAGGTLPGIFESYTVGDDFFMVFDIPTTHVFTNSTHAGPHHGPQTNMFAADMGSVTGTKFTRHTNCTWCHLNDTTAASGFGHNFTPDIGQCDDCHGTDLDITAKQATIATRMAALEVKLESIHAIHVDEATGEAHPLYASLPRAQWQAFWNFMCIYEDKSQGVHNFGYADQLLTAAEAALAK